MDDAHSLEAQYSNYFQIGYNAHEFLLDFGLLYVDLTQARFHTRIITSPAYAKELYRTLGDSIEQYETSYGPIARSDDDTSG